MTISKANPQPPQGATMFRLSTSFAKLVFPLALIIASHIANAQAPDEQRILDLTNEARTEGGLKPVVWDPALAKAAYAHAVLMSKESELSHRYSNEQDLPERAAQAGAHFSTIAENIAMGTSPGQVHGAWMQSQGHHDNLMNTNVDHLGVAIVRARGALFVVADFAQAVQSLSPVEVEAAIGKTITDKGLTLTDNAADARKYCALEGKSEGSAESGMIAKPRFLMRWQNSDIAKLPPELEQALASRQFQQAAVGACNPKGNGAGGPVFSGYRVAVLLY